MKVGFKHIRSVMLLLTGCFGILSAGAHVKRAEVYNACVPVVLNRTHNVVAECCIEHDGVSPARLDGIEVRLGGLSSGEVRSVRLLYTGTMSALLSRSTSYAMRDEFRRLGGGQRLYADPGYAIEQDAVGPVISSLLSLTSGRQLVKGRNYFYVSVETDIERIGSLSRPFTLEVTGIRVNGESVAFASSGSTTTGGAFRSASTATTGSMPTAFRDWSRPRRVRCWGSTTCGTARVSTCRSTSTSD